MPHTHHTHTHTRTNTLCSHEKESRVAQHCAAKSKDAASTKATRKWWQVLTSGLLGGCAYPVLSLDVVNGLMLRCLLSDLSEQALVWSVKISFTYHIITIFAETPLKPVEPKVMHWWRWKIHGLKPHSQDLQYIDLQMLQGADLSSHEEILRRSGRFNS